MYTHTIYIYIYLFIHISTTHFSVTTIGGLAPKCSQPVNRGLVMNPSTFGKTFRPQDAAASNRFPSSEQFDPGRQGLEDEFPLKKKSGSVLIYQVNLPEGLPENVGKNLNPLVLHSTFPIT